MTYKSSFDNSKEAVTLAAKINDANLVSGNGFIDFDNVANNDFYIAEEVTVKGNNTKRPDVVIYVNGIALAVIELKKSSVSVSNGIRQNLTNQTANFIEKIFYNYSVLHGG